MALVPSNIDRQGISRGACSCGDCTLYALPATGNACDFCGCRPPAHANLSTASVVPTPAPVYTTVPTPAPVMAPTPAPVYTTPIPSGPAPGMCALPGCSRPAYVDNGRALDYCGRTHSDEARKRGLISPHSPGPVAPVKTCSLSGCSKPVAPGFDYCGRTHANDAKNQPPPSGGGLGGIIVVLTGGPSHAPNPNVCLIPGCGKPVYVDSSSGKKHDFCSVSHANQGKAQGLSKKLSPPSTSTVQLLSTSDPKYRDIKDQFQTKFLHTTPPAVVSILKINASQALVTRYENYRKKIIAKRPNLAQGGKGHAGPGNEQRRFHGTSRQACDLGLNGNETLCSSSGCGCCGIIRTGLMLSKAQTNISFGRFGRGLYLTSTSSKSHGYNAGTSLGLGKGYRAMFVCKVIVGKGKKLMTDHTTLTCAPDGCDSVLGEVGTALNYDEIIVYDEDAVLPAYMVVYRD